MLAPCTCPTCSGPLLRHISNRGIYWRCSNCRENFDANYPYLGIEVKRNEVVSLSNLANFESAVLH